MSNDIFKNQAGLTQPKKLAYEGRVAQGLITAILAISLSNVEL